MDSFLSWIGGKRLLRKEIVKRLWPGRGNYIEVFGGAAWVLFYKEKEPVEVYNDINSELVNLFLQVKYHPEAILKEFEFLLNSRQIFNNFKNYLGLTEIQRAARFLYLVRFSFGAKADSFGTSKTCSPLKLSTIIAQIQKAHQRLNSVVIENLSFEKCIEKYDSPKSFFYCDPPYVKGMDYKCFGINFTLDDHVRLAEILKNIQGKFLLSYDDNEFIRELYKDYIIEEFERLNGINRKKIRNNYFKELLIRNYEL